MGIVRLVVILLKSLCVTRALLIYVDTENGIEDHRCWTGGINLPCKDYELAKEGALYLNVSINDIVDASSENQTCQQKNLLDSLHHLRCNKYKHTVYNHGTVMCDRNEISVRNCDCVTYNKDECSVLLGACPYGCGFTTSKLSWSAQSFHPLPENLSEYNYAMCGRLNRDDPMCSKCRKEFSPLVYSYDLKCIPCNKSHYNWLKFTAVAFLPLSFFYFIVILFRIDATSPYLYGFITLNQALASPTSLRGLFLTLKGHYLLGARILAIPYTIWNLDFFRSLPLNICLDLTTLQTLALDYAIAIYPLLLVVITYIVIELHARGCRVLIWLWRPFHRCCVRFTRAMDIQSSIIKAFATFLLLSYVKLLNATLDILLPVQLYQVRSPNEDDSGWYVYYDASYQYFNIDHLPYAIMCITLFLVLGLFPLVLLIIYPMKCFQKRCYGANNYALRTFVDAFQGHYKDGTEPGTCDCRWFAGIYFLGRIMILYVIFGVVKNAVCYALEGFTFMGIGMLIIILQPFKSAKVNTYHTLLPLFMAICCFSITTVSQAESKALWMIKFLTPLAAIFYMSPILAVMVYAVCKSYWRCRILWLKIRRRNPELENLVIENGNREN
jgi:hypothetical protein